MTAQFEVYEDSKGNFKWHLKLDTGQYIASSPNGLMGRGTKRSAASNRCRLKRSPPGWWIHLGGRSPRRLQRDLRERPPQN